MSPRTYTKTFLPLESNPEIFTSLAHNLGLSSALKFTEGYDLDEDVGEVLAYVLAFPTDEGYDERHDNDDGNHKRETEHGGTEVGSKQGDEKDGVERKADGEGVFWLRQTIHNACGLYALLHATCNGEARKQISITPPSPLLPLSILSILSNATNITPEPNSILQTLLTTLSLHHSSFLSTSPDLETFYTTAATSGDTRTPEQGEEVDWHYTCFVPGPDVRVLFELDGDRWGPLERGVLADDGSDFGEKARGTIKEYFEGGEGRGKEGMFSVLALVREGRE
jgi:ubiquitin carboxyl-terminal hydrolase L3